MFQRRLTLPARSFFLFGPRGTGKTTWIGSVLPRARRYDLLQPAELVRLVRDPAVFRQEVTALPRGSWVVVDEVQRLPALLDQVHALLAEAPRTWRFALTGSSARKLRRGDANLLAGRAITRQLLPLTAAEAGPALALDGWLGWGGLPLVRSERARTARVDLLEAYVTTYLAEEIRAEALVRDLGGRGRFRLDPRRPRGRDRGQGGQPLASARRAPAQGAPARGRRRPLLRSLRRRPGAP